MVEAALILEAGAAERFDRLIVVTCREEQRVERFADALKVDLEAARQEVQSPDGGPVARRRKGQSGRLRDRQLRLARLDPLAGSPRFINNFGTNWAKNLAAERAGQSYGGPLRTARVRVTYHWSAAWCPAACLRAGALD